MRVLIVDDNELLLEVAKATLSASGFEVVTSDSAVGFSATLASARPDIALVDVLMPALNGNQVIEAARPSYPALPQTALAKVGDEWDIGYSEYGSNPPEPVYTNRVFTGHMTGSGRISFQ